MRCRYDFQAPTHLLALPLAALPLPGSGSSSGSTAGALNTSTPLALQPLPLLNVPEETLWPGATVYAARRRLVVSYSGHVVANGSQSVGGLQCAYVFAAESQCLLPTYRTHLLRLNASVLRWESLNASATGPGTPVDIRNGSAVGLPFMYASGLRLLYDDSGWDPTANTGDTVWAVGGFLSPVGGILENTTAYRLDLETMVWSILPTSGTPPDNGQLGTAIALGTMALDAPARTVLVYGGVAWNRVVTTGACYALNLSSGVWSTLLSCAWTAGPFTTFGATVVQLPRTRQALILTGGATDYTAGPLEVSMGSLRRGSAATACLPTACAVCMRSPHYAEMLRRGTWQSSCHAVRCTCTWVHEATRAAAEAGNAALLATLALAFQRSHAERQRSRCDPLQPSCLMMGHAQLPPPSHH